ncbi:AbrB family transcriptional regulator [Sagittula sp. MA-2]|jgi:membrane AbrB-like protein|uniref:AbrB family transcriptional regulator n=1 Tax=Sagittula sp. MA-2 TaxID=3048007 RepID=UPI0024C47162|nr:AbrB family transcriptional regulator [Sagittula sp. MA-2]WHZ37537.1 AbrB family transcriptional regulator [Sagittula sp. MA-2]
MHLPKITLRVVLQTAMMLAIGAIGGLLAYWVRWPMPWMFGALLAAGVTVRLVQPVSLSDYDFPMDFRTFFVALIGVMIGTQVTPDLLSLAGELPITLSALVLFVVAAHAGNMAIFHRIGGYDKSTAFFSGTPGGLMESIFMGEAAGADTRILTVQQFLRIILVITLLPVGLSLWIGHPVGSAAGLTIGGDKPPVTPMALVMIAITAVLGLWVGRRIRLPAAQLTGPLLLAAAATVTGVLDLHLPFWLIATAQLVIGVSLGMRFKGVDAGLLRRSLWLAALSVSYMLLLGMTFAIVLERLTGIAFLHLFISFAPGGVAEMSVVALSLAANPALVSLHHVVRILITVVEMPLAAKVMGLRPPRF